MPLPLRGFAFALLALPLGSAALAQADENAPKMRQFSDEEVAAVAMPTLAFVEKPADVQNYDRYFYFHRPDTSFDEAFADLLECDALSSDLAEFSGGMGIGDLNRGLQTYAYASGPLGGLIGSAMGDTMMNAIAGPMERRRVRRVNMRSCMHFKGYRRFGLPKSVWQEFNFEGGDSGGERGVGNRSLLARARVASGPTPQTRVLIP